MHRGPTNIKGGTNDKLKVTAVRVYVIVVLNIKP